MLASRSMILLSRKSIPGFYIADYTLLKLHNTDRCQNIAIFQLYSFISLFFLLIFSTILSLLIKNMVQCKQKYTLPTLNSISLSLFLYIFRLSSNHHPLIIRGSVTLTVWNWKNKITIRTRAYESKRAKFKQEM